MLLWLPPLLKAISVCDSVFLPAKGKKKTLWLLFKWTFVVTVGVFESTVEMRVYMHEYITGPSQSALFRSAGSLHVGRWGTRPSRGGIWSAILCPWCRISSAACGCLDDGRPRNSSSTPSSRNMGHTSWSQPRWEVSAATDIQYAYPWHYGFILNGD